jgi:hypothetical protein
MGGLLLRLLSMRVERGYMYCRISPLEEGVVGSRVGYMYDDVVVVVVVTCRSKPYLACLQVYMYLFTCHAAFL